MLSELNFSRVDREADQMPLLVSRAFDVRTETSSDFEDPLRATSHLISLSADQGQELCRATPCGRLRVGFGVAEANRLKISTFNQSDLSERAVHVCAMRLPASEAESSNL